MIGVYLRACRSSYGVATRYNNTIHRSFARASLQNRKGFKDVLEEKMKVKSDLDKRLVEEGDRFDPNDPNITDKALADMHLTMQILPEKLLKRVAKVFGKYPHSELKQMGIEYQRFYQLLHATEKPVDLTQFEKVASLLIQNPFRNTSDIYKLDPMLIWQMKGRKGKSTFFENIKQMEKDEELQQKVNDM